MTVESTNSKQLPQQMGINTEYPFTLDVLLEDPTEEEAKSAIKAKIKLADNTELDLIYNDPGENGYQVVLNSNRLGGKVIVNNKRTILDYITIYRYYQMKQEADYQDFNAAPADTFEQSYDKLTMIDQQQQEVLDRCVKVEMTSNVDPENFTEHVERIYESIDNVDTVSGIKQEVVTTAENIESIINCSENIQSIIDAPQQAQNAAVSANNALQSENNAETWAEGTDEEVQALGGTHSSKRWSELASGKEYADKDLSNITEAGKDVIRDTAGSGFSLFDVVEKDHILSFEESMGFGLLGTYVYKEPVAGSRYGYPDFYNECVAQKSTEGNTLLALKNNVEVVGSPVVNNGVLSGFSTSNYVKLPQIFNPGSSTWEIVIPFSVDNFDTEQSIFMSCIEGSNPNRYLLLAVEPNTGEIRCYYNYEQTNWQTTGSFGAENTISAGKKYWVKVEYDGTHLKGSLSTDGDDYTLCLNEEIAAPATASTNNITTLGLYAANEKTLPLNGSIDLKECYIKIDNELWWSGATTATKNPNGHIFYDIADKATVDEIFSQRGEAWFYGVDTENERVFLPRGTRSQYTVNTDETGDYVEAGLPNITGTMIADISEGVATGALKIDTIYSGAMWSGSTNVARMRNWSLDASLSNPIYGNSDTVQPYATKKLLYIVVGNVKVQSAASDVVDVTTTENDTVPLFTGQYFNFKPNNPSWLKAGEQQDSGGIYTSCYNKLVQALTDNIWGIKVIDSAAMEEGTDYSEYWIVYQDAMRFRTPLTACKEIMPGNEITSSLGFSSNPTNTVESYTVPYNGYITIIGYKTSTSNTLTVKLNGTIVSQTRALASGLSSESYFFARKGDIVTVSTDSTSTGWVIATQTITKATANGELYFKAANVVENLEILNVGQVMEELSNKVNVSNTSWAINACMPDYSAQSTFTLPASGQTFTVPYDCLLTVCLIDVGVGVFVLRLNDASGAIIAEAASATVQTEVQVSVYLKKGWVVYNDSTVSRYTSCYITPLIGAEGAN